MVAQGWVRSGVWVSSIPWHCLVVDVSDGVVAAALRQVEELVSLADAIAGGVGVDAGESERARAAVVVFAASAGIDTLASLAVVPGAEIERLRGRLAALGLETSHHRVTGQGSAVLAEHPAVGSPAATSADDRARVLSTFERVQHERIDSWRVRTGPPLGETPGVLALHRVLGRSSTVAVMLVEMHAYTTGLQLHLLLLGRGDRPPFIPDNPTMAARMGVDAASQPRLQVRLADGQTAAMLGMREIVGRSELLRGRPLLVAVGSSGSNNRLARSYYLTPLPSGDLTITFSWAEQHLEETQTVISSTDLMAATSSNTTIWPSGTL